MAQSEDLKSKRQQSVKDFLSIRECMIQPHIGYSSSSGEHEKPIVSGVEATTDERGSVQLITTSSICDKVEYPTLPREIVESFNEFRYNASELGPVLSDQSSEVSLTLEIIE